MATSPLSLDTAAAAAALSLAAPVLSLARVLSSLASVLSPTFMPGETDSLSPSPEAAVSLLLRARGAASPKPPRRTLRRVVSSCTPMQQPSTLGTSTTSHESSPFFLTELYATAESPESSNWKTIR